MAVLKFTTMDNGAQFAMISGISTMLMLYVASSASLVQPPIITMQSTVRGLVLSGWMMSTVKEERHRYSSALITGGDKHLAVGTARMQAWSAFKITTKRAC